MYECESWAIKKAECWRMDAFKLWCWRRLLRVLWTARRSNQAILKEIKPEYSWKDWCWSWNSNTWPPDVKSWLPGKDPDAGKDRRQEKKGTTEDEMVEWHHQLNGHEFERALEMVKDQKAWHAAVHEIAESWIQLRPWTTAATIFVNYLSVKFLKNIFFEFGVYS